MVAEALDCASRDRINIHGAAQSIWRARPTRSAPCGWYELFDGLSCQEVAKVLLFDDDTIRVAGSRSRRTQAFRAKPAIPAHDFSSPHQTGPLP